MGKTLGLNVVGGPGWIAGTLYLRNLVLTLSRLPDHARPRIWVFGETTPVFDAEILALPGVEKRALSAPPKPGFWSRLRKPQKPALSGRPELDGVDRVFPAGAKDLGPKAVHWIPDLQHLGLPHLFSAKEAGKRTRDFARLAAGSAKIVFSSEAACADFRRHFPEARAELVVWRFCSVLDLPGGSVETPDLPEKYIYIANQFWAHKNHLQAFEAIKLLRDRGLRAPIVCTGPLSDYRDPDHPARVLGFLKDHSLEDQVSVLGLIERETQIEIMRRAAVVLQPSRFEGWSTVIEDARSLGRPVIASDLPVHREQVPDAPKFPLDDAAALADVIERVWPELAPGPNRAAEQAAHARARARQDAAAAEFVAGVFGDTGA